MATLLSADRMSPIGIHGLHSVEDSCFPSMSRGASCEFRTTARSIRRAGGGNGADCIDASATWEFAGHDERAVSEIKRGFRT